MPTLAIIARLDSPPMPFWDAQLAVIARLGGPGPFREADWHIHAIGLGITILIGYALFHLFYFIIAAQLKRAERIRAFLETVTTFHDAGLPMEEKLIALANVNKRPPVPSSWLREKLWPRNTAVAPYNHHFGSKFRKVVRHLQSGMTLRQALELEHTFLPAAIRKSLILGLETDDLDPVRLLMKDPVPGAASRATGIANYFLLPVIVFGLVIGGGFFHFVVPKFQRMMSEICAGKELPALKYMDILHEFNIPILLAFLSIIFLSVSVYLHIWGWRMMNNASWNSIGSLIHYILPWRRWRLTASFSKNLLHLLRSGVDEKDALVDAALATDNRVLIHRARKGLEKLEAGETLPSILATDFDQGKELAWRLRNGLRDNDETDRFAESLDGWCAYLDARAFRLEHAVAQCLTVFLLLAISALVCLLAYGVFGSLMALVEGMTLW